MYSMKYIAKNNSDVFACRSVVKDAYEHITQHRSSAEDAGTELRNAMHLLQRLSNSNMEMDASQATSINLVYDSSMGPRVLVVRGCGAAACNGPIPSMARSRAANQTSAAGDA